MVVTRNFEKEYRKVRILDEILSFRTNILNHQLKVMVTCYKIIPLNTIKDKVSL